jgi:hypothetical protein
VEVVCAWCSERPARLTLIADWAEIQEVCSVACARSVLDQWEHYTRVGQTLDSADNAIQGG